MIIHSTVLAPDGRRMSKSLGTGIDPLEVIDGARRRRDALRAAEDVLDAGRALLGGAIEEGRKLANKLWNVARLHPRQRGAERPEPRPQSLEERWILARIDAARGRDRGRARPLRLLAGGRRSTTSPSTTSATGTPRRSSRASTTTTRTRGDRARRARAAARAAPSVMPHVTEEIWSQLPARESRLIVAPWPERRRAPPTTWTRSSACRTAAASFRRSGVRRRAEGEEQRIFEAVVRPERMHGERRRRGGAASVCGRRSRAPRACSRTSASSRGRRRRSSRPSARSSSATAASSMRSAADTHLDWLECADALARGVRARADARAARRARRAAAGASPRSTSSARTASRRRRG